MKKFLLIIIAVMFILPVTGSAQDNSTQANSQSTYDHPLPVRQHVKKAPKRAKIKARRRAPKMRRHTRAPRPHKR